MNHFSTALLRQPVFSEIVIDSFAGGGGASTGIEMALNALQRAGVSLHNTDVTIAINHDGAALAMHEANHPSTVHLEADIWTVDPLSTTNGRPVGLLWASPDCRHFSSAKGGAPVSDTVRGLADVVVHWAEQVRPRLIFLENVVEFQNWGPTIIGPKRKRIADPKRKGTKFDRWAAKFRKLGYRVEMRVLRACDYGAPTIRRRLYIIMRLDGEPIVWPQPTHGDPASSAVKAGELQAWRTAAEIIDWSLPCHSILMDRPEGREYTRSTGFKIIRPLADATLGRIAAGVKRHVLDNPTPFVVTRNHTGDGFRGQALDEPFKTVAGARDAHGLVLPFVTTYYGERDGKNDRSSSLAEPLRTITTAPRHGIVHAFMTSHHTNDPYGVHVEAPMRTVTGIPKIDPVLVYAAMPPLSPELEAKARRVAAFLRSYGSWDGGEFVTVGDHIVYDIGMRMLTPRELARAQGFPEDYILAAPYNGQVLSESKQRHKLGNSVCPPAAKALVEANYLPRTRSPYRADQGWLFERQGA